MKKVLLACLILFSSIYPTQAHRSRTNPIIINDDNGGGVEEFSKWYQRIARSKTQVKITGWCVSACTLVLTLPREQVCVTPQASLGFHLASVSGPGGSLYDNELTNVLIKRYYPEIVQKWLDTRRPLTARVVYMTFDQIIAFQIFDECK